ncbi:MAG: hypothetical protein Q9182_002345 [Xanthomendoza sp. 2 TL-2023]
MPTTPATKHPCFAHHRHLCPKSFTSFSAILSHLGSGNCRSGITKDRINTLITYFPNCETVINPNQKAWLRAGYARNEVQPDDYDPQSLKWHCPHCEYVSTGSKKLAKHMRYRSCTLGPLHVQLRALHAPMEKPFRCPRCNSSFKEISDVLGHAESGSCRPGMKNQALVDLISFLKAEIGKWGVPSVAESGKGVEDCQTTKVDNDEQAPPTEGEKLTKRRLPIDMPIEVSDAQLKGSLIFNTSNHLDCIKKLPAPPTSSDQQIMNADPYPTKRMKRETTLRPEGNEPADYYQRSISETLRILTRRGEWTPPPSMRVLKKVIPDPDENRTTSLINELKSLGFPSHLTIEDTLKLLTENAEQSTSSGHQLASRAGYPSAKPMQQIIATGIEQGWTATEIWKEIVRKGAWSRPPAPVIHRKENTDTTGPLHLVDDDETDDSAVRSSHSHYSDDPSSSRSHPSSPTRQNRFDRSHITAQTPCKRSRWGDTEDEHGSSDDNDEEGGVAL